MQTTAAEMTDTEADTEADTEDDTEADTEADTETKNKGKKKGRKNEKRKQTRDNDEEETLGGGDGVLEKSAKKCDSGSNKMKTKNKKKTKNKEKEEKKTKTKQSMDHLFSVDLVEQAKRHIIFLRTLHKQGITINSKKDLLEESFRRYSQLWLPFVAHHRHRNHHCASLDNTNNGKINQTPTATNIALIPPPDIAWFWHCHRLAPYRYAKYVQGVFFRTGHHDDDDDDDDVFKVLDPSHPFVVQLEKNNKDCNDTWRRLVSSSSLFSSSSKLSSTLTNPDNEDYAEISQCTRDLFAEMYPNESFFLVSSILLSLSSTTTTTPATGNLLGGFDLVESCKRQAEFLFQVSAPNFYDINGTFLQEGITNYSRFVKLTNHPQHLKHQLPHPLVPTYQIDLIWHTHILSSIGNYHEDVMKLTAACATTTGNSCSRRTIILNHDDSIDNDRSEGSVLDTSFQQTRKLWKDVYGLEYVVLGGMYRGEPPPEYYHIDWTPSSQLPSASNGMSIDHALAFIPAKTLFPCVRNRYMEGYVFGFGGVFVCVCVLVVFGAFSCLLFFNSFLHSFSSRTSIGCSIFIYFCRQGVWVLQFEYS
jgi:hypothetical protein